MDGNLEVLIANVGFPIAISMYLLTILTDSINELSKNILNMRKG